MITLCSLSLSAAYGFHVPLRNYSLTHSMFQYDCVDLVDNVMLLLDGTWPKVMMLSGFVRFQVRLTLELNTGEFWYDQEEPLSSIGIIRDADESRMNIHQLVQMLVCMAHPDRYKWKIILRDCNVACLQLFPGFRVIGPQIMHVYDVSGPESLVFNTVKGLQKCISFAQVFTRTVVTNVSAHLQLGALDSFALKR